MSLSKIVEPVRITPYKSTEISFELSRTFSTPSLNVAAAKIFELNQICDAFNSLRHIHFPNIADGKIGAFLGVNAFAFTYPTHVIPGNQNQPFGVKTKLGWTSPVNMRTVSQQPLSSPQVSRRRNLFSMCQETEQMNPDLTNLFNSSGVLKQMAIRRTVNKFTQNKKNSFLIF